GIVEQRSRHSRCAEQVGRGDQLAAIAIKLDELDVAERINAVAPGNAVGDGEVAGIDDIAQRVVRNLAAELERIGAATAIDRVREVMKPVANLNGDVVVDGRTDQRGRIAGAGQRDGLARGPGREMRRGEIDAGSGDNKTRAGSARECS